MVKKILAIVLAVTIFMAVPSFALTYTDVDVSTEEGKAIGVLSELGVLSGMGDGSFSPYTNLTRGQFAKIAVCILGKTEDAVVKTAAFSDVKATDWFSGYVNVVAKEGIITGYPDGSFGANDNITYAQTIAILIRLLGYDAADVGYKWPQGYIEKASVLNLTEGMTFSANDMITREKAALLIYRALLTDMKGYDAALITKMDKNVYEDAVIIATKNENAALMENQVQSDKGTFTFNSNVADMSEFVGYEGTLVVNDKGEAIVFEPSGKITKTEYTVASVYSEGNMDSVTVITDESMTVTLNNKTVVYMEGNTYTASKLAEGLTPGSKVALFSENGVLKHAVANEYKYQGPKTLLANKEVESIFNISDIDTLKVVRKGLSASLEDIEVYDVLYYSERTNTVYVYTDKVTGIYEEAYPMKSNVSRVTVAGKEYTLSAIEAVNKLNESEGAFEIGDRVTLLLGEDGTVTDAVCLTEDHIINYGVIIGYGRSLTEDDDRQLQGSTEYYVTVVTAAGEEEKYSVESDKYEEYIGEICSIDFKQGLAQLTFPVKQRAEGLVDKETKTFGEYRFATDYAILERVDRNGEKAVVSKLTIADLDGIELSKNDVIHMQTNIKGEIIVLYVNDVSGNSNLYGILIDTPDEKKGTYTILSGADTYKNNGTYASMAKGDCVSYYNALLGAEMIELKTVGEGYKVVSCVDNIIKVDQKSYQMADNVMVYAGKTVSDMKSISLSEAVGLKGTVSLHSERRIDNGGKVRVIRIYTN